jgi:hypothetical protein
MEVSGQLHATATLSQGKEPLVAPEYEAGWDPGPIQMLWIGNKRLSLPAMGTQFLEHPACSFMTTPTTLPPGNILIFMNNLAIEIHKGIRQSQIVSHFMNRCLKYKH